jgi:hypothetical protein
VAWWLYIVLVSAYPGIFLLQVGVCRGRSSLVTGWGRMGVVGESGCEGAERVVQK